MKNKKIIAFLLIIIAVIMIGSGAVMMRDNGDSKDKEKNPDSSTPSAPSEETSQCVIDYENMDFKSVSYKDDTYTIEFKTLSCMNEVKENFYQSSDQKFEMELSVLNDDFQKEMENLTAQYYDQKDKNLHISPYTFKQNENDFCSLLKVNEVDDNENIISITYHILYPVDGKTFNLRLKYIKDDTIKNDWVMEDGFFEEIANEIKVSK